MLCHGGAPIWTGLTVKTGENCPNYRDFCSDRTFWPRTHPNLNAHSPLINSALFRIPTTRWNGSESNVQIKVLLLFISGFIAFVTPQAHASGTLAHLTLSHTYTFPDTTQQKLDKRGAAVHRATLHFLTLTSSQTQRNKTRKRGAAGLNPNPNANASNGMQQTTAG